MILRGAQIHRNGHGKCGLLPNPTLSINRAQLPSAGVLAKTRMSLAHFEILRRDFTQRGTHLSDSKDLELFWRTFADCSEQKNQSTRRDGMPGSHAGVSHGGVMACKERARVIHTRVGDLCHGYIGELWQVSWQWWRPYSNV
jgi:hypothetical protein